MPGLIVDENKGLLMSMHKEIFRRLGVDSTLLFQPTLRIQASFEHGRLDAYFPELDENFPQGNFVVSKPFYQRKIHLFTRIDSRYRNLSDLKGKLIGAVKGYSYGKKVTNNSDISLSFAKSDDANVERLMRGYIDAIIGDDISTFFSVINSKHISKIYYSPDEPIHTLDMHYVCQNTNKGKNLCDAIDAVLSDMIDEGLIVYDRTSGQPAILIPNK
ncbi:transporter substrate-binding domain-containing protein [Vibrio sp. JC009]|uniref:substrate-binding periplasmic protein n=1 Tax=Vibrio sp. JC009 TaxID=2912314 RepID=UPI0023B1DA6C|nr:transporter substrate-binding domain-containing protein [Vibrio sp. JC009]WED24944.1 transporter substrate-binding domain-containing protein [Vibrio sp. JC009]